MPDKPDDLKKFFKESSDEMDSLFDMMSRMHRPVVLSSESRWYPQADVFETDDEFVVIMDIAHIDPKDISIVYKDNSLMVNGVRREVSTFNKRHYHKMEIDYGPFERKIPVPVIIDERNIVTRYKDGFLQIRLKKIEDRRRKERKIDIDWQE